VADVAPWCERGHRARAGELHPAHNPKTETP
jgi:hypothetical protein